jgi:hypothetical protein
LVSCHLPFFFHLPLPPFPALSAPKRNVRLHDNDVALWPSGTCLASSSWSLSGVLFPKLCCLMHFLAHPPCWVQKLAQRILTVHVV